MDHNLRLNFQQVQKALKNNKADTFELIPILKQLPGRDYDEQLFLVFDVLRQNVEACRLDGGKTSDLKISVFNSSKVLKRFDYNPILVGIVDDEVSLAKLRRLSKAVNSRRISPVGAEEEEIVRVYNKNVLKVSWVIISVRHFINNGALFYYQNFET